MPITMRNFRMKMNEYTALQWMVFTNIYTSCTMQQIIYMDTLDVAKWLMPFEKKSIYFERCFLYSETKIKQLNLLLIFSSLH